MGGEFALTLRFAPWTMVTPALPLRFATETIVSLRERERSVCRTATDKVRLRVLYAIKAGADNCWGPRGIF